MNKCVWLMAALCLATESGKTATITQFQNISTQETNWTENLSFTQFDPALGTLNSILFSLTGGIEARIGFENIKGPTSTVTSSAAATITVRDPISNVVLVQVIPANTITDVLTGFDLNFNYGGTSGRNYGYQPGDLLFVTVGPDLGARTATATTSVSHSPLSSFIGTGQVLVPVTAINLTTVTGTGGSINSTFDTLAEAELTLIYDYTAAPIVVPEPATSALAGLSLVILGAAWRKRRC